jgi:hypothetical protein
MEDDRTVVVDIVHQKDTIAQLGDQGTEVGALAFAGFGEGPFESGQDPFFVVFGLAVCR